MVLAALSNEQPTRAVVERHKTEVWTSTTGRLARL